jgi:ferritin-like protein
VFGKSYVRTLIDRSAETPGDRRRFMKVAGATGLGLVGAGALAGTVATSASASTLSDDSNSISDATVLNFALNLEYLEAEFYSYAAHGYGLPGSLTSGTGKSGPVEGGSKVWFKSKAIGQLAKEIARDEYEHVAFLRAALGKYAVGRPEINISSSFTAAATAAGLIKAGEKFDVYASEDNFLLGAFIFEDVGVTAYKGAAPLIVNKTYLGAAAGILAVEAYHASTIRSRLYDRGLSAQADAISAARNSLDGSGSDQGITVGGWENIVPTDSNGLAFGRTPGEVLNIVYLTPKAAKKGGFFPDGVNGTLNTSGTA